MSKNLIAKPITKEIYDRLKENIKKEGLAPTVALMSVGNDPASEFYINNIIIKAERIGIKVAYQEFSNDISEAELIAAIEKENRNPKTTAIMVQKPLPKQIDENKIASHIAPNKDVDGFSPYNLGSLMIGQEALLPCTPIAVMTLIEHYGIDLIGKHTVLCGRSNIVGKPLLNLLIKKDTPGNATVTLCHSLTKDFHYYSRQADILITAIGIPKFIKEEHIKEGAIIIDVGTNEIVENGKTLYVGDVDYDGCFEKASAITPVPGGVGSITTAILMENIYKAAKKSLTTDCTEEV